MAGLPLQSSTECAMYCGLVRGTATDVQEATLIGAEKELIGVAFTEEGFPISDMFADLGDDANRHYLNSVLGCPGPDTERTLGIRRRSKECNAKMGEHALAEYKLVL